MILKFNKKKAPAELKASKEKIKKLIIEKLENDYYDETKKSTREFDHLIETIFSSSEKETYRRLQPL